MTRYLPLAACTILTLLGAAAHAQDQPFEPKASYPAKFICGGSSEAFQEGVVRGFHATSISLHNPSERPVRFAKSVSRALPLQRSEGTSSVLTDTIPPLGTIEVECNEIRMMLPVSMAAQFRSGVLRITSSGPLDVVAVYTSRPHDGDVSTIDVEPVPTHDIVGKPDRREIDLVVSDIDLGTLRVSCPTGAGSCTALVAVTIGNIGSADSDTAEVRVTFDPDQSVSMDESIAGGLAAGASETFTSEAMTGGNCYDPGCRICAVIDSDNLVEEADETNNQLCREAPG